MEYTMNESFATLCQLCSINTQSENLDPKTINWQSVWELALRQRVVPVIADRIKQLGITVPDDIARLMEENIQNNLFKGMKQAAELISLTQLFQQHNIRFVVFKGIAQIKLADLELHQRHHGDIDLLIENSDDLWRADKVLREKMGYRRLKLASINKLNSSQEKHLLAYDKDITYISKKGINIELHFKLLPSNTMCPFSSQHIFSNRTHFLLGNTLVPCMNKKNHQLYLLLHGSISRWFRLKWLCDIPRISDNGKCYIDSEILEKDQTTSTERMISQGLGMAHKFLSMPISDNVKKQLKNDPKISFITNKSEEFLTSEKVLFEHRPKISQNFLTYYFNLLKYKLCLMKDWQYKKDVIKQNATDTLDWESISLPAILFPLYYLIHPFLWLKRQF